MDLKKLLPENYLKSIEVVNVQDALTFYNNIYRSDLEDFKKQFFVSTCTWALPYWENYVGLKPNIGVSEETRKKLVIAKLSGQGTCTREMLLDICKNYTGSDVRIEDNINDYSITITFLSHEDIKNLNALKGIIEEIKPAWLGYEFKFSFASYEQLKKYTHKMLHQYTHKIIRNL